jgi:DHA1 family multidrug resistance protein-like MFS transporter
MQSKSERRETAVDQRLVAPSISYRKAIILLAAATFFYWSALYFYLPILPVYAQSLGASLSGVGIVVATYALPQLLLRIPMGMWADTTGKRKYLLASGVAMVVIGAVGLGLAPNPLVLGIARTATGIGASVWTIFTVYFASFYSQGNPRRAIGVISFVMGAAMVAATVGGGFTASARGPEFAFFLAAALGIVSLFFVLPTREPITARQTEATSWHSLISVAKEPLLLSASVMGMLLCFVNFSSVLGFTPVYAARIGASSRELGIITMVAQAALAVGSLIAIYIAEQYGNRVTVIIGAILLAIGLLAVPFIKSVYVLEATSFLMGWVPVYWVLF